MAGPRHGPRDGVALLSVRAHVEAAEGVAEG